MKIPPRMPPKPVAGSVKQTVKKEAAKKTGFAEKSGFEAGVRKAGAAAKGARIGGSVNREISRDFLGIKRGLRAGDDTAVKLGVGALAQRLGLKLPDGAKTGWDAVGALGKALGHGMADATKFNRDDYRHVMKLARAQGGKINDPDPSLRL